MTLTSRRTDAVFTLFALLFVCDLSYGFTIIRRRQTGLAKSSSVLLLKKDDREAPEITNNPFTKASWYAVEAFGKVFGSPVKNAATDFVVDRSKPPSSMQETLQRLQEDNDRQYFLSGTVDELIYAEDCTFSDPFVSFQGRRRFVENLQNLGSFIAKYSARPLDSITELDGTPFVVETKFMVKLQLNLPWKPVLAWPWGVVCTIDPKTNLIVEHQEKWEIEPLEVSLLLSFVDSIYIYIYSHCSYVLTHS